MFLTLSALFAVSLVVQPDIPPQAWPLVLAACAFLPALAVGIARLGRGVFFLVAALLFGAALVLCAVGTAITWLEGFSEGVAIPKVLGIGAFSWLRISLYLFYALGVVAAVLSAEGWVLYWRQAHEAR
jgi:hypothetical protein